MNFIRFIYFNKVVNRLNKNLNIRLKAYLAFFLVGLMITGYSVYILISYANLKNNETHIRDAHALNNNYMSLMVLMERQASLLHIEEDNITILDDEILRSASKLEKSISNFKNLELRQQLNLQKLLNTLYKIENLNIFSQKSTITFMLTDQAKLKSAHDKLDEVIYELEPHQAIFEAYITDIATLTDEIYQRKNHWIFILLGVGLLVSIVIANFISLRITSPIGKLKDNIKILEQGDYNLDSNLELLDNDEIKDIATGIDSIGETIKETVLFTEKIGKNEFDAELKLAESGKLASALRSMRDSLKEVTDENEKQKQIEEKRNWIVKGVADLGNILRSNVDDIQDLYFSILQTIITYIGANQGGLFIIKDKDDRKVLELSACYAYSRKKFIHKELAIGDGLVGQCALEKEITNLTEIPDEYIQISSGLGEANPNNLILVPLILNEEIFGVVELASFELFEDHHIEYLKQSAESIASTISSSLTNITTRSLLEKTQTQAEDIAAREEEMRQNMEELEATQEESDRRELEFQGVLQALTASTYNIEYDMDGTIININEPFANMIGLPRNKIIGMNHKDGIEFTKESRASYNQFWEDLKNGKQKKEVTKHLKQDTSNEYMWLSEMYTPILDERGNAYKVMKIAFDVTELLAQQKKDKS